MTVILPTPESNSGANDWSDVFANDNALKGYVETLQNEVAAATGFTWYTPKVIATEQTRESTEYGTLTTADEIKEVVLPTNGLIVLGYVAKVKSSVSAQGKLAVFLSANQLKSGYTAVAQEAETAGTNFGTISTSWHGLVFGESAGTFPTTGATMEATPPTPAIANFQVGGFCPIYAAAGTYDISVQYKAVSGSVTSKERKLWVATLG